MVLKDPVRWRQLVAEYGALRRQERGVSPQARGQRFNGLVAELLTTFGIEAQANQLSVGELDVTFRYKERRFILEAKWERRKTGTGPIAKLQRRVEQRMLGVVGVFLSLEGFTPDALAEVDKGRRLDLVLLDRSHWEAMLSGFVPPPELLDLLTDAAAFRGSAYTSLAGLLLHREQPPKVSFSPPRGRGGPPPGAVEGIDSSVVVDGIEVPVLGASADRAGRLLLTAPRGVLAADLGSRRLAWAAPVTGCVGRAVPSSDDHLLVRRGHGVGRYADGQVWAVSSGSADPGRGLLLAHPDGSVWCLDQGPLQDDGSARPALARVGSQVGDESWLTVPAEAARASIAEWITDGLLLVAGESGALVHDRVRDEWRRLSAPPLTCAVPAGRGQVLAVTEDAQLLLLDAGSGAHHRLGAFRGTVGTPYCGVRVGTDDACFVARHLPPHRGGSGVVRVHLAGARSAPPVDGTGRAQPPAPPAAGSTAGGADARRAAGAPVVGGPDSGQRSAPTHPVPGLAVPGLAVPGLSADAETRAAEQGRGERDGRSVALGLPMQAFEDLAEAHFDLPRWLAPCREHWRAVAGGPASPAAQVPVWLPVLARHLGSYAAPDGAAESYFTPSPRYVLGFRDGLRGAWEEAVRANVIPPDQQARREWLHGRIQGVSGKPRLVATLGEVQRAASTARQRAAAIWIGRVLLWLLLCLSGVGVLVVLCHGPLPGHGLVCGKRVWQVGQVPVRRASSACRRRSTA